jgi:chromosome segregation ATPase
MASRTQLKSSFSAGQRIGESSFATLIDSLAHLTDDVNSGALASGESVSAIQTTMAALQSLADQTKQELDDYMGTHPSTAEMQDADAVLSNTLNASITQMSSERVAKDAELTTQMSTLQANFDAHEVMLDAKWDDTNYKVDQLPSTFATIADLNTRETQLEELANSKAPEVHFHDEYATKVSIANFITLDDVPKYAAEVHGHQASEITGLDELFMTPAETQALIDENKVTLNLEAVLFDNFYDKDEVDQKFHVARWRTDQISLFNPTVVSITQPLIDIASNEVKVSISNVRAEEVAKDDAVRSLIASTRAEVEVSIGNTNSTVESNRVTAELGRITLQGNIDQVQINASASIASSQSHVLAELASVRAEALQETSSNASAITQAELDSNTYTDTKIDNLLNGAGAAYDTLKELQDHIVSNDSDAAVELTNQIGIVQGQIDTNDSDITALQGRATTLESRATSLEGRATALEAQDVTFQSNLDTFQTTYNNLVASNNSLTAAYQGLLDRVETLENTAYAQAGYIFP